MSDRHSRKTLAAMGLTELRSEAKRLGIRGMAKATRYVITSEIRKFQQAKPMANGTRAANYAIQARLQGRTLVKPTSRQSRRMRKHDNRNGVAA